MSTTSTNAAGQEPEKAVNPPGDDAAATVALTVVGFAFFWTCTLIVLFSNTFAPASDNSADGFLFRFLFLVGFAAVPFLSYSAFTELLARAAYRTAARVLLCLAVASLTCAVAMTGSGLPHPPVWLQAIGRALTGAFASQMLVLWGVVWSRIDADRAENSFCAACIAGAVLLAVVAGSFMLFAPTILCAGACTVLCIVSVACHVLCERRLPNAEDVPADRRASRTRFHFGGVSMATPFVASAALGIALALNGLRLGVGIAFPVALVGIGIGSLVALVVIRIARRTPRVSIIERVVFPIFGACLLALPFAESDLAFEAIVGILIADLSCYLVFHWDILVALAYRKNLLPAYHFSQGIIATTLGCAVGWGAIAIPLEALGIDMFAYTALGWGQSGVPALIGGAGSISISLVACLGCALALIVTLALVPYAANEHTEPLFGAPARDSSPVAGIEAPAPTLEDACQQVCERFSLTPREREVFSFLARGRNADHIAASLVISPHTAKTHSSRIYRKLQINSQQQLISVVEAELQHLQES